MRLCLRRCVQCLDRTCARTAIVAESEQNARPKYWLPVLYLDNPSPVEQGCPRLSFWLPIGSGSVRLQEHSGYSYVESRSAGKTKERPSQHLAKAMCRASTRATTRRRTSHSHVYSSPPAEYAVTHDGQYTSRVLSYIDGPRMVSIELIGEISCLYHARRMSPRDRCSGQSPPPALLPHPRRCSCGSGRRAFTLFVLRLADRLHLHLGGPRPLPVQHWDSGGLHETSHGVLSSTHRAGSISRSA